MEDAPKPTSMPSILGGSYALDDHNHPHTPIFIVEFQNAKLAVIATEYPRRSPLQSKQTRNIISHVRRSLDINRSPGIVRHRVTKRFEAMTQNGRLRAWMENKSDGEVLAGFVGVVVAPDGHSAAADRAPATQVCRSPEEAREWVEDEAIALGLSVEWVEGAAH